MMDHFESQELTSLVPQQPRTYPVEAFRSGNVVRLTARVKNLVKIRRIASKSAGPEIIGLGCETG